MINDFGLALIRTHSLPFKTKINEQYILSLDAISFDIGFVKKLNENKVFKDALFFSSRSLFNDFLKLVELQENSLVFDNLDKKQRSAFKSVISYYLRMSSRCTPFGLSAGVGILKIGNSDDITLKPFDSYKTNIEYDYKFTEGLTKSLQSSLQTIGKVNIFANDTVLVIGDIVKYIVEKDGTFKHLSVRNSKSLQAIMNLFERPTTLVHAYEKFGADIEIDSFQDTILELIEYGLLIEDIHPDPFSEHPTRNILEKLGAVNNTKIHLDYLNSLRDIEVDYADSILRKEEKLVNAKSEANNTYKVEVGLKFKNNSLSKNHLKQITTTIEWLASVKGFVYSQDLDSFKKSFYIKYGHAKIPLLEALDEFTGIRYPAGATPVSNSKIKRNYINSPRNKDEQLTLSAWEAGLLKIYHQGISKGNGAKTLVLHEDDFGKSGENISNLPTSLYTCFSLLKGVDGKDCIDFQYCGTSNNLRLISRYTHIDKDIRALSEACFQSEKVMHPNIIFAEIGYTPKDSMANVNTRPDIYEYYIPIFSRSKTATAIPLSDLTISLFEDEIILTSTTLQKRVVPTFSTAYNYKAKFFGLYNFLSELAFQHSTNGLYWNWGLLSNVLKHRPRVVFKNVILSKESWLIAKEDLNNDLTDENILNYLNKIGVDLKCNIKEGNDNFLLVDLSNTFSIQLLIDQINKHGFVELEENLFLKINDNLVSTEDEQSYFCNEIVLPLYNKNGKRYREISPTKDYIEKEPAFTPSGIISDKWSQINIFCEFEKIDKILTKLRSDILIDDFEYFFIRYNDPSSHIRFRIRKVDLSIQIDPINDINRILQDLFIKEEISGLQWETYKRETDVYHFIDYDLVEQIFIADSKFAMDVLNLYSENFKNPNFDFKILICVLSCLKLLELFTFNDLEQITVVKYLIEQHKRGLRIDDSLPNKKTFSTNYKTFKNLMLEFSSELRQTLRFFEARESRCMKIVPELKKLAYEDQTILVERILHLSINRILDHDFQNTELAVYDIVLRSLMQKNYIHPDTMLFRFLPQANLPN